MYQGVIRLAKVDVESSNLFTRSIFFKGLGEILSPIFCPEVAELWFGAVIHSA